MRAYLAGGVVCPGLHHQSENLASRSAPFNLPHTSKSWFLQSCKGSCFKVTKATYIERNSFRWPPSLRGKLHLFPEKCKSSSDWFLASHRGYLHLIRMPNLSRLCSCTAPGALLCVLSPQNLVWNVIMAGSRRKWKKNMNFRRQCLSCPCLFFAPVIIRVLRERIKEMDDKNRGKKCPSKNVHMLWEDEDKKM